MSRLALFHRRAQLGEFVRDSLPKLGELVLLLLFVTDQITQLAKRARKFGDGHFVWAEIAVSAGQQISALTGLRTLNEIERLRYLIAHRKRAHYPLVVAPVASAEPECRGHDQGRKRRGDDQAPVEQSERLWVS